MGVSCGTCGGCWAQQYTMLEGAVGRGLRDDIMEEALRREEMRKG